MTLMRSCNDCTRKKAEKYHESIKPQKLITELNNGELLDDDYYGRSYDLLPTVNTSIPSRENTEEDEETFKIYELHKILDPSHRSLEHGFTRSDDGLWYMASTTNMHNCTGEMIEWWYNHCDSTERFKWWHPTCNVHGEFDPTFYAVQPEDRLVGHAIGHRFTCIKKWLNNGTGENVSSDHFEEILQHVDFLHPAEFINTDDLPAAGITACVIGKISYRDPHLGEISVGHVCHIVREHMGGQVTMTTRLWLGYIDKTDQNFPSPRFANYVGNTVLYRYLKFTQSFIKSLWIQTVEENSCLAAFLPDFYRQELLVLEQRKQLNESLAEAAKAANEYEEMSESEQSEVSEEEVSESEEEIIIGKLVENSSKGVTDKKKESDVRVPSSTLEFGEESMSEDSDDDKEVEQKVQVPISKNMGLGEIDKFYEYDTTNEEEEGNEGKERSRRRSKSVEKSAGRGKGGGSTSTAPSSVPTPTPTPTSSALVASTSRVGKGVGI